MNGSERTRECDVIKMVLSVVLVGVNYTGNLRFTKLGYSVFLRSALILKRLNIQYVSRMNTSV